MSYRERAVTVFPLELPLLLSRGLSSRSLKLVESGQPKLREETAPKITVAHPNRGLFCAHNNAAAGINGFREQVLCTCTVSDPGCFHLVAPEFLKRLPPCSLQLGKNQLQDLKWVLLCWSPEVPLAPGPGLVPEPWPGFQGLRRAIFHVPRRVKNQILVSTCEFDPLSSGS